MGYRGGIRELRVRVVEGQENCKVFRASGHEPAGEGRKAPRSIRIH